MEFLRLCISEGGNCSGMVGPGGISERRSPDTFNPGLPMLRWSLTFLVLALVAALLGFGGVASTSASIAVILFYVFLVVFLVTLAIGLVTGRKTVV